MKPLLIEPHTHISTILESEPSKGGLFIGSVICLLKPDLLTSNDIGAVLTCSGETFQQGSKSDFMRSNLCSLGLPHKIVEASDTENYSLDRHFRECIDFIREHRQSGRSVLVHCHAGKSRSASIVIAYLVEELGMSLEGAYRLTKERRPIVKPNQGFWMQLQQFQRSLVRNLSSVQSCLNFRQPTLQKRMSLQVRPQFLNGSSHNLSQSLCYTKVTTEISHPAPEPLGESLQQQQNIPFKKQKRIKELADSQVSDIKQKIRQFMQNRRGVS